MLIITQGCIRRNYWGRVENTPLACRDCGHTYESKCPCQAYGSIPKRYFLYNTKTHKPILGKFGLPKLFERAW